MKAALLAILSGLALALPVLGEPTPTPEQIEFFEAKIRPVLVEHCYRCHSAEAEKLKGGLLLDSREGWQTGGDSGPGVVPGKPNESHLLTAIRYDDPDTEMPPKQKLSDAVIADFERWIEMGAPDPREAPVGAKVRNVLYKPGDAEAHWAFQPNRKTAPPAIDDPWIKTPIDAFILQKLRAAGLSPSPPADPRSLIRRALYDLTGLPPSVAIVETFVRESRIEASRDNETRRQSDKGKAPANNLSPSPHLPVSLSSSLRTEAFEPLIDSLLNSPQYGVKYARHWLDLARYADTNGIRNAPTAPNPYHPYAWTYRDWVIGALNEDLPYNRFVEQQIAGDHVATAANPQAYAALGFLRVGKEFGQNINDRIDDRIDALSKTFLGLTVACARCHDHKFDPVYQSDYYALHGIFSSSEDIDLDLIEPSALPGHAEFVAETERMLDDARSDARDNINDYLSEMVHRSADFLLAAQQFRDGELEAKTAERAAREVDLKPIPFQAWVGALEFWEKRGDRVFAPWFAFDEDSPADFPKDIAAGKIVTNPLVAKAIVEHPPTSCEQLAAIYQQLAIDTEAAMQKRYPLTEVIVTLVNVQRKWRGEEYDPFADSPRVLDDPDQDELRRVLLGFEGPWGGERMPPQLLMSSGAGDYKNIIKSTLHDIERMNGEHPAAPVRAMAMRDLSKPVDSPIFIRGNADQPGALVPRAYLAHFTSDEKKSTPFTDGSGRLELAHAITAEGNPLTARVIVNRVWQWHFGRGLVATPSDFGLNGSPPSHPDLLDWLANWFATDANWSLKKLHRLIMTSSVYQQSALPAKEVGTLEKDPGNLLLWRFPPRQLGYEELRDTITLYAGKLHTGRLGGRPAKEDDDPRRTLFRFIDRMELPYESLIFNFPDADLTAAERESSIVPQQALYFLNSPWVMQHASDIADRTTGPTATRLNDLYNILFQRPPTDRERQMAEAFLVGNDNNWNRLTHALLATNELMFLH